MSFFRKLVWTWTFEVLVMKFEVFSEGFYFAELTQQCIYHRSFTLSHFHISTFPKSYLLSAHFCLTEITASDLVTQR
jgi:hypothetical protein